MQRRVPLQSLTGNREHEAAGLVRDTIYLLTPRGYTDRIGYRRYQPNRLRRFL